MDARLERGAPALSEVWVPDGLPAEPLLRRPDRQVGSMSRMELLDVGRSQLQAELNRLEAERAQRAAVADLF